MTDVGVVISDDTIHYLDHVVVRWVSAEKLTADKICDNLSHTHTHQPGKLKELKGSTKSNQGNGIWKAENAKSIWDTNTTGKCLHLYLHGVRALVGEQGRSN